MKLIKNSCGGGNGCLTPAEVLPTYIVRKPA